MENRESMPLVSMIMPIYNAEKYLTEAVESVLAQTYPHWELLLVDDGSTDGSLRIAEAFAAKDSRIQSYVNDSGKHGPGIARNFGMDRIRGKYTYFLDADDWVDKDLLLDTVTLAEKTDADLVPFGFVIEDGEKRTVKKLRPCGRFEHKDFQAVANEILRGTWSECHELIQSKLLSDLRHNDFTRGEDICFQLDLLRRVRRVCGIDKAYYHYRVVKDSVSHAPTWDAQFLEQSVTLWEKEKAFLAYSGLDETSQIVKNTAIERYTGCLYRMCKKRCPWSLREKVRQAKALGEAMGIQAYKQGFDLRPFSGGRKLTKFFVKHNAEKAILSAGTLYFKIR